MSWKLSTFAIALFGLVASSSAAGGQDAPRKLAGPRPDAPLSRLRSAPACDDAGLLAAAKQSDKELIEKQKTCPVSDQPLGAMGKPVKVIVKGRTVFLCCLGCKKKLLADPEKYFKKLDEQK